MITGNQQLCAILDRELIGFLTSVNTVGQPQTSPVWFIRDGDDLIVYNQPTAPRLVSIAANPRVAFNLRGDIHGEGVVSLEGEARVEDIGSSLELPGYIDKYAKDIESLGWTPDVFAAEYDTALRIVVTRVRAHGLDLLGVRGSDDAM